MTHVAPAVLAAEPEVVQEIAQQIRAAKTITIAGHIRPDGDCLGSGLGLLHLVESIGVKARFFTPGPVPPCFKYLPAFDRIELTPPGWTPDLTIYVDSAGADRVLEGWYPDGPVANIDHHLSNPNFADWNWVDVQATAAAEMIYRLHVAMDTPLTPELATCLYTGLMTDTGGFRYSNTCRMTFIAAGRLVEAGANPAAIAEAVFESRPQAQVRLTGEVLSNLHFELGGQFVWASVTQELLKRIDAEGVEPDGLSGEIRSIEGVEVGILFMETPEGWTRVGLRGRGKTNLNELAAILGGGGHRNASGAFIRAPFAETLERALATSREWLSARL